jgi:hypothetical protein
MKTLEKPPWEGLLDDPDLIESWDMGPPYDPPDIKGKDEATAIELMTEWFRDNFEDPAHQTPWVEGEYWYIWGGPHRVREELEDAFGDVASAELIEAAASEFEDMEWAPAGCRMQPDDPENELVAAKQKLMAGFINSEDDAATTAPFNKHAVALVLHELYQLQRRLDSIRRAVEGES